MSIFRGDVNGHSPCRLLSETPTDRFNVLTSPNGAWHLGIGDPTPVGWLTVAAYFLAGWACLTVFLACSRTDGKFTAARFWLLLTVALWALGINKQLDLQTSLTEIGRSLAHTGGWYERRHDVQFYFLVAIGVSGAVALAGLICLLWPLSVSRALALIGVTSLLTFVLIRASSFHHVDIFLGQTALGLRWNWILELSGIGLVGIGAALERRTSTSQF